MNNNVIAAGLYVWLQQNRPVVLIEYLETMIAEEQAGLAQALEARDEQGSTITDADLEVAYQALGKHFAEIVLYRPGRTVQDVKQLIAALDYEWAVMNDESVCATLRTKVAKAQKRDVDTTTTKEN